MRYLVTYIVGNREWCHCHRQTSYRTEEYHDIKNIAPDMLEKWKDCLGDLEIDEIHLIDDVNEEIVAAIKNDFRRLTEKAKEAKENHRLEDKEKDERRLYTRLKEKFGK